MLPIVTEQQWGEFGDDGFLRLGRLLATGELQALQDDIDQIMLGKAPVPYDRMLMQMDSDTGRYEDAGEQSKGFKGPSLSYRKIQDLELDPLFHAYLERPLFREICRRVYGLSTPIAIYRAMFMNKPARKGTWLPWHQDRWTQLDRDPLITIWTALDPATLANGCVQIIPGEPRRRPREPGAPIRIPDRGSGANARAQGASRVPGAGARGSGAAPQPSPPRFRRQRGRTYHDARSASATWMRGRRTEPAPGTHPCSMGPTDRLRAALSERRGPPSGIRAPQDSYFNSNR